MGQECISIQQKYLPSASESQSRDRICMYYIDDRTIFQTFLIIY